MNTAWALVALVGLASRLASGQAATPTPAPAPTKQPSPPPARAQGTAPAMPPALKLGDRVARAQAVLQAVPELVIVADRASYLSALSAWTPSRRFPVLIDDGSARAAELIARFSRGFEPARVVRYRASAVASDAKGGFDVVEPQALRDVVAKAWDLPASLNDKGMVVALRERKHALQGVVLLNPRDEAWVAGVALAAHRGQPIIARDIIRNPSGSLTVAQADELASSLERECDALGLAFKDLGDEIDAITLAANAPAKIGAGGGESLALSDRLGRPGLGIELNDRWAWSSQVFGDAPQSAYMAMCAVFLVPRSSWMFDGYPTDGPWKQYDLSEAGEELKAQAWDVEVMDTPNNGAKDWRIRASRPVDAGLLMVNTKGNADFFDLEPGQCKPDDVPILERPSILHIVHSWSAFVPGDRNLLMGRWMERGVYFYVGSVHEPYLQAFLPGRNVIARALAGGPLAAAVRHDKSQLWKVATFGDPLIVLSSGMRRSTEKLSLEGAASTDVLDQLRERLKADEFATVFRDLLIAGKDVELARLAGAVVQQKPSALDQDTLELVVLPLFRQGKIDEMLSAYRLLDRDRAARADLRDALWLATYQRLAKPTPELAQLLRANVREPNITRDALAAASVIARSADNPAAGREAALAWLELLKNGLTDKATREKLEQATRQAVEAWGRE